MMNSKLTQSSTMRCIWIALSAFIITVALTATIRFGNPISTVIQHRTDNCGEAESSQQLTNVVFWEHEEYKNLSRKYDYLWQDLLTPNGGLIKVKEKDQSRHEYGISMYHQLHCLQMIRSAIQDLQSQARGDDPAEHDHTNTLGDQGHSQHSHSHPGEMHWLHCLDYLRQVRNFPES
jgi:hypothetical protein